jgi:antitoxin MazE
MLARVQKWGNSLALRIPKQVAVEAGINLESEVDLVVRDHQIIITPARGEYSLADLVNRITTGQRSSMARNHARQRYVRVGDRSSRFAVV